MGKSSSNIWSHAKRINDTAKCNLCDEIVLAKGGNTSTIKRHLVAIHNIDVDKADTATRPITGYLTPTRQVMSKARSAEIDRHIAAFVARDGRPISTVEGDGFVALMNFLEPDYVVKSRTTTTVHIKRMYNDGATQLKSLSSQAIYVAFTTDLWTSVQNIAYMCVTAHWLSPDWELRSAILETREMAEKHTGVNLSIRLAEVAEAWGIPESSIAATVHDNGSNINLAMELLDAWPD
jgi:hypothetical protein